LGIFESTDCKRGSRGLAPKKLTAGDQSLAVPNMIREPVSHPAVRRWRSRLFIWYCLSVQRNNISNVNCSTKTKAVSSALVWDLKQSYPGHPEAKAFRAYNLFLVSGFKFLLANYLFTAVVSGVGISCIEFSHFSDSNSGVINADRVENSEYVTLAKFAGELVKKLTICQTINIVVRLNLPCIIPSQLVLKKLRFCGKKPVDEELAACAIAGVIELSAIKVNPQGTSQLPGTSSRPVGILPTNVNGSKDIAWEKFIIN